VGDWGTALNAAFPPRFGLFREELQPSPCAKRRLGAVGQFRAMRDGIAGIHGIPGNLESTTCRA